MTQPGHFAERAIAVVPTVTREALEAALTLVAQRGFADVLGKIERPLFDTTAHRAPPTERHGR